MATKVKVILFCRRAMQWVSENINYREMQNGLETDCIYKRINRFLVGKETRVRAAITKPFVLQSIFTAIRSGKYHLPFSAAKEKSLDNQPPTLLFYRPAVVELFLKEMPR